MNQFTVDLIASIIIFLILFFQSKKRGSLVHTIEGKLKYFHLLVVFLIIALNSNIHRFINFTLTHYPQLEEHLNSFPGIFGEGFNWFLWFFNIGVGCISLYGAFMLLLKPEGKKLLIQVLFAVLYINLAFQFYTGFFRASPEQYDLFVLLSPQIIVMFLFHTGVYVSFAYFYSRKIIVEKLQLA